MEHISKILSEMDLYKDLLDKHKSSVESLGDTYYLHSILRKFKRIEEFVNTTGQPICNIASIWNICEVSDCTPIQLFDTLQKGNIFIFTEQTAQEYCWDICRLLDPQNALIRVQENLYIEWI